MNAGMLPKGWLWLCLGLSLWACSGPNPQTSQPGSRPTASATPRLSPVASLRPSASSSAIPVPGPAPSASASTGAESGPIPELDVISRSDTSILVEWQPIQGVIRWRVYFEGDEIASLEPGQTRYEFSRLAPETTYTLGLRGETEALSGETVLLRQATARAESGATPRPSATPSASPRPSATPTPGATPDPGFSPGPVCMASGTACGSLASCNSICCSKSSSLKQENRVCD